MPICIAVIGGHASPLPEGHSLVPMWPTAGKLTLEPWRVPRLICTQLALRSRSRLESRSRVGMVVSCWDRDFGL